MLANSTPGQVTSKEQLRKRLARSEGQVRGIAHMINEDRQCVDVLTQIAAVQAALDKVALCLLDDHVRGRLVEADVGGEPDALSNEVLAAVARLRRGG